MTIFIDRQPENGNQILDANTKDVKLLSGSLSKTPKADYRAGRNGRMFLKSGEEEHFPNLDEDSGNTKEEWMTDGHGWAGQK